MLKVVSFKYLGSEGSTTFGRPSDIGKCEGMVTVLTKLDGLLSGTLKSNHLRVETISLVRSQAGDLLDRESPPAAISTQAAFVTQVPIEIDNKSGPSIERPKTRSGGAVAELLAKLRPIRPQNPVQEKETVVRKATRVPLADSGKISRDSSILNPVSDDRAREMSSKLDARANKQRQSPKSSQSTYCESKGHLAYSKHPEAPIPMSQIPASDDSEKENSQESIKRMVRHGDHRGGRKAEGITENKAGNLTNAFYDMFLNKNPLKSSRRIPRVYSRIPEDQRILLESKDSWFGPQAGGRPSSANLPPGVLQNLTKFIDHRLAESLSNHEDEAMDVESEHAENRSDNSRDSKCENQGKGENEHSESCEEDDGDSMVSWSISDGDEDRPRGGNLDSENVATSGTRDESQNTADHGQTRTEEFLSSGFSGPADDFVEAVKPEEATDKEFASSWFPTLDPCTRHHDCLEGNDVRFPPDAHPIRFVESCNSSEDEQMNMDGLPGIRIAGGNAMRNLPLNQTQGTVTSSLSKAPPKRYRQIPAFPSSSPTDEEPLELAVPHAIGDEIDEPVENAPEAANTSEELQSTAVQNESLVQVEQTPFTDPLLPSGLIHLGAPGLSQPSNGRKRGHDDISSDLVIPATFNDTNPPQHLSNFHNKEGFTLSDSEPAKRTLTDRRVMTAQIQRIHTTNEGKEEDTLAQQQLFEELESSQRKKATVDSAQKQAAFSTTSPAWRSPASDGKPLHEIQSPIKELSTPSASSISPAHHKTQKTPLKRRQPMPAASAISQETGSVRDAREMARAKRHMYTKRFSFTEQDRPVQLGFKTQPGSLTAKQVTPNRSANSVAERPAVLTTPITNMVLFEQPSSEVSISTFPLPIRTDPVEICTTIMSNEATNGTDEIPSLQMASVQSDDGPGCPSFFEKFKLSYPEYIGRQKDFTRALVYIDWLWKNNHFLNRSLCDDFIHVFSDQYIEHVQKNHNSGRDVMTGWEFYGHRDQDPKFEKQIITRDNLQGAISSLDPQEVEECRGRFREQKPRQDHDSSSLSGHTTKSEASVTTRENQTRQESIKVVSSPLGVGMILESDSTETHQDTQSREAFFETPSQLPGAARFHVSSTSVNSWHAASVYGSQTKTARRLPWSQNGSRQTQGTSSPVSKARPSTSTPSSRIDHNHSRSLGVHSGFPEALRQEPGSPILGKAADPFSGPVPELPTRAESISTSLRDGGLVKSPTLQLDKPGSRRAASMSQAGVDDLEKVEGWLEAQQPDSAVPKRIIPFNEFVSKRKRTSWLASSMSTPRKRFCTKPVKAGTSEPMEPETQAWDF